MKTKNQFVVKPWADASKSIMLKIWNSYIKFLNPENYIEHKQDALDDTFGDNVDFSREVLRFENEDKEIVGFAGLEKVSKNKNTRNIFYRILPEYLDSILPQFVIKNCLALAKNCATSEVLIRVKGTKNPFDPALNLYGYNPFHFSWGMIMTEIPSKIIPATKILKDITIQYAEKLDDYTRFAFIYNEVFHEEFGFNETSATYWEDYIEFQKKYFRLGFFLAYDKQTLVGFGYVCTHRETKITYGRTLAVLPEYQNIGIGSELIKKVLEFLQNEEIKEYRFHVDGKNDKAMNLYKRFGFRELEKTTRRYYRLK